MPRNRSRSPDDLVAAERSLERLFRLNMGRRLHDRQSAAVGASVTRAGYALLRSLDEGGPQPMGTLAETCAMDPAVAARQVRVLQDAGLLERIPSDDDRRIAIARLTPAGRKVFRGIVRVRTAYLGEVLDGWQQEDRAELIRLVDRLVEGLTSTPFRMDGVEPEMGRTGT